jgi:hypothetical protein
LRLPGPGVERETTVDQAHGWVGLQWGFVAVWTAQDGLARERRNAAEQRIGLVSRCSDQGTRSTPAAAELRRIAQATV